jgi:hypothetical protein
MNTESQPPQLGTETVVVETSVTDDEAARKRAREFDDALYAALLSRAYSDQAHALVDHVVTMVAAHELAAGIRTNKRDNSRSAKRSARSGASSIPRVVSRSICNSTASPCTAQPLGHDAW